MKSLKFENLVEILSPIKKKYEIVLYGSQVEGGSRPDSDIDVAVITRENKIENNIKIQEDLFGIFPLNFDIRVFELFPIYIQISIIENFIVIFGETEVYIHHLRIRWIFKYKFIKSNTGKVWLLTSFVGKT